MKTVIHFVSHSCGPQECDCRPRCHAREGDEIKVSSSIQAVNCKNCLRGLEKDRRPGLPARVKTVTEERDQLKTENAGLKTGYEAYEQVVQGLKAEVEALRKSAPSKEVIWCACGDGHAANSYGAGFMDANDGVCANCDAAMSKGEKS